MTDSAYQDPVVAGRFAAGLPSPAGIYDALIGGAHNLAVDREAALRLAEAVPGARRAALDNRAFLRRVVEFLAREADITQFLDIGTGLPSGGHVHEIAQAVNPAARVVYADNDPEVVTRAQGLVTGLPGVAVVEGDVRYPGHLLTERPVIGTLDFDRPVAVLMVAVLHFVNDSQAPWHHVRRITSRLAAGSYLVISHVTGDDLLPDSAARAEGTYLGTTSDCTARTKGDIFRFFDGLNLIPPGLANVADWQPGRPTEPPSRPVLFWAGVGVKPEHGLFDSDWRHIS